MSLFIEITACDRQKLASAVQNTHDSESIRALPLVKMLSNLPTSSIAGPVMIINALWYSCPSGYPSLLLQIMSTTKEPARYYDENATGLLGASEHRQ